MRSQVYRREIDGPDIVRLVGRGDHVKVEYGGQFVDQVRLSDVRRGVAISLKGGGELALLGGGGAERIVVKLDGSRLKPIVTSFDWPRYAPLVVMITGVANLAVAGLAYAEFEPAWRLAIRREVLLVGLVFVVLHWSRTRFANVAGALVMTSDVVWVLAVGIWSPVTLLLRLFVAGYLSRVAYGEWRSISDAP